MDREFKGIWIPQEIWLSEHLSLQEKIILAEIESLTQNDKGYCCVSNKYFSEFFGLSPSRISHIISDLSKKGILDTENVKKGKQIIERRIRINTDAELL